MDLQRALQSSAAGVYIDLPHSNEFAEAFNSLKNTGICKSWTDPTTNKVRLVAAAAAAANAAATTTKAAAAATTTPKQQQ